MAMETADYVHPLDAAYAASDHTKDCLDRVVDRMYQNHMIDVDHSNPETVTAAAELLRIDPEWCRCDDEQDGRCPMSALADPRGPKHEIMDVERPTDGGLVRLRLFCGHAIEVNQHFDFRTGESAHCLPCRSGGAR